MAIPETFDARLVSAADLSPSVRELVFERADGAPFVFDAGQWISLLLPLPDGEVRRAYSIASAPVGLPRFELAVTRVETGLASQYLHGLAPGAILRAVGPQGFFTRTLEAPSLFVATGTGVAPLRSMILSAIHTRSSSRMTLLFGVRAEADILYRSEFEALSESEPRFRVAFTLSNPSDAWNGRRGYVQAHVKELFEELADAARPQALTREQSPPHAYVCGLQNMVGSVRDLLKTELSLPRQRIHTERYD